MIAMKIFLFWRNLLQRYDKQRNHFKNHLQFVLTVNEDMSEYIKFLQCGTLQTLTGNVFTYEEQFKFGIKPVDSNCLSEDVIVGNTELLNVQQLHEYITNGKVTGM